MAKKTIAVATTEDLGSTVALLPKLPEFNAPAIAKQFKDLSDQATRVLEGAQRAVIEDAESASKGTEFLAKINQRIKDTDEARKAASGGFDKLVKALNTLFNKGPAFRFEQAANIMQAKLGGYARAERAKAEAEAQKERERVAAEAAARAAEAVEEGDSAGALEILQAAAVEIPAEKVQIRGATSALVGVKRKVGKVTDLRKFLAWAAASPSPSALAVCGGITVGQRELNQLAATVIAINENPLAGAPADIPGFEASYEETFGAR